jgi:hypothetical protein
MGPNGSAETIEERQAAAHERARIHHAAAEEATRQAAVAEDERERERLKRLADRHASSAALHERAAQFQAEAIRRAERRTAAAEGSAETTPG